MTKKYTNTFSAIHWIHAAILIFILIGATLNLPDLPAKGGDLSPFKGHMILGIVASILTVIRLLMLWKQPTLKPLDMGAFRETLVRWNHRLIYLFLILTGASGLATANSTNLGEVVIFGNNPSVYNGPDGITATLGSVHSASAYILMALIAMHVAGVIFYMIKSKENILGRVGFASKDN